LEPSLSDQQVLVDLGLTLKQARVYLALCRTGSSRILQLSKTSKVTRPDVYEALGKLQHLGLVEKIIKRPVEFRATPLDEGLTLLLRTKENQYRKVRTETEILRDTIRIEKLEPQNQTEKPQFVLVPEGEAVIQRIGTAIENAESSIEGVLSWKRFSRGISSTFAESIEKAWAKNVKIRFIVEEPPKDKTSKEMVQFFREKPHTQIRFIHGHPNTVFGIYDRKEVYVIVVSKTDLPSSPALWSNDDALIALASDHFEMLWATATENTDQDSPRRKHIDPS